MPDFVFLFLMAAVLPATTLGLVIIDQYIKGGFNKAKSAFYSGIKYVAFCILAGLIVYAFFFFANLGKDVPQ